MGKTVAVGISGGVDSAVAAHLLKQQGHEVIGLFMKNWEEYDENGVCTSEADFRDVREVCGKLGIPYYTVNFAKEYLDGVFSYFLEQYRAGRTPNPDVLCNREIKFKPFLEHALRLGADYIATGHYCGIIHEGGKHFLTRARDASKDQTYFLNQLSQKQLERVLFPLSDIPKSEVREIASALGLSVAEKKDSTGICFIGERRFREFLQKYIPAQPGDILTADGKRVGRHEGAMYYTEGQRKGLSIGGVRGGEGRWFVIKKDVANNIVYVSQGDADELYSRRIVCEGFNFIPEAPPSASFRCTAKYRYRQPDRAVRAEILGDGRVIIEFDEPQRAVSCGQYAVLYDGNYCLGGGEIVAKER